MFLGRLFHNNGSDCSVSKYHLFIYNIRRIARLFPTVHYALNLRDAARNEFLRKLWKEDTILDAGGNRSARRKPARASMDREPNSHTTLARLGIEPGPHW